MSCEHGRVCDRAWGASSLNRDGSHKLKGRQRAGFRLQRRPVTASSLTTLQPSDIVPAMQHLKAFPHGDCPPAAIIFDLDGTLTETELLKARSYARTVTILLESQDIDELRLLDVESPPSYCIQALQDHNDANGTMECCQAKERHDIAQRAADAAIKSYLSNIGGTTEAVAKGIVDSLHLQAALQPKMAEYGLQEPWQALYSYDLRDISTSDMQIASQNLHAQLADFGLQSPVRWRKEIYASTFATDSNIYDARYSHNIDMLKRAATSGLPVSVATQSTTDDAIRVTKILGVNSFLKTVLGREKVAKPKPDPDIYLAAAKAMGVHPERCLVFEDSVTGLTAATRAGMQVVAVPNPFSRPLLKAQTILSQDAIAYDLKDLDNIVAQQCSRFCAT